MVKTQRNIATEFVYQIQKYLAHFGMLEADLGALIGTGSSDINAIMNLQKSLGLIRLDRIASVFGLTYYEFGNPSHPFPSFDNLPSETKIMIEKRRVLGIPNRNYENDIAGNLDKIIHESTLLHNPVTAEEIRLHFPDDIKDTIKATRITDLLKKSGRDEIVVKVDKRGKEFLFQLKEFVDK